MGDRDAELPSTFSALSLDTKDYEIIRLYLAEKQKHGGKSEVRLCFLPAATQPIGDEQLCFESILNSLMTEGIIKQNQGWPRIDTAASREVLGMVWSPPLVSREKEVNLIVSRVASVMAVTSSRKDLLLIDGIPGSGKTRLLQGAAECCAASDNSTAVFAVTFNNVQDAITNNALETQLLGISPVLPVVLRLLHTYTGSCLPWGAFACKILGSLEQRHSPAQYKTVLVQHFTIDAVLTHFMRHHGKSRGLVLVDETLRWLDLGPYDAHIQSMVSEICRACDQEGRAVVFSAMASSFLTNTMTLGSSRTIETITLTPLGTDESRCLTRVALSESMHELQRITGLVEADLVANLDALAVGGLPRAAETLRREVRCHAPAWTQGFGSVSALVGCVYGSLQGKYRIPWQLAILAVTSEDTWPLDKPLPGLKETARVAMIRGWLPQKDRHAKVAKVYLAPALLLSKLQTCDGGAVLLRRAAYNFVQLISMGPRNVWEELVTRTIILRSHVDYHLRLISSNMQGRVDQSGDGTSSDDEATTSSDDEATSSSPEEIADSNAFIALESIFKLFPHIRTNGYMTLMPVRVANRLSNVVLRYRRRAPPTPAEIADQSHLIRHVFTSESDTEPGIDALMFAAKEGIIGLPLNTEDLLAVGIQAKWSRSGDTDSLSLADICDARNSFHHTMTKVGWKESQLILIFIVHHHVVPTVFSGNMLASAVPEDIGILGVGNGVEDWLGPSLHHIALCVQSMHVLQGPYALYTPEQRQTFDI